MNDNFAAATTMATRQIQQQAMLGTRSPLVNGALAAMQERGPLGLIFATTIRSGAPDPPRVVPLRSDRVQMETAAVLPARLGLAIGCNWQVPTWT